MTRITMLMNHGVMADGQVWLKKNESYTLEDKLADELIAWRRAVPFGYDANNASTMFTKRETATVPIPEKRTTRKRVAKNDKAGEN